MINKTNFLPKILLPKPGYSYCISTPKRKEINFKNFKKLLQKSKFKVITVDIDSSVIDKEGNQEGAVN